jgi:hypothetical protein
MGKVAINLFAWSIAISFGIFAWVYLESDYFFYWDGQREAAGGGHIFWSEPDGPAQMVLLKLFGPAIEPYIYQFREACRPVYQKIHESGFYEPHLVTGEPPSAPKFLRTVSQESFACPPAAEQPQK